MLSHKLSCYSVAFGGKIYKVLSQDQVFMFVDSECVSSKLRSPKMSVTEKCLRRQLFSSLFPNLFLFSSCLLCLFVQTSRIRGQLSEHVQFLISLSTAFWMGFVIGLSFPGTPSPLNCISTSHTVQLHYTRMQTRVLTRTNAHTQCRSFHHITIVFINNLYSSTKMFMFEIYSSSSSSNSCSLFTGNTKILFS